MTRRGLPARAQDPATATRRTVGAGRRTVSDSGFTLIELLVVITILGILSAVVVFAVRGAGDKGAGNAAATDKRIIRTAQETFCATYNRYARDMDELVAGPRNDVSGGRDGRGFLSEASTYHSVVGTDGGGPCNGWSYQIGEPKAPVVDLCLPDTWCEAEGPDIFSDNMVQLPNGKVLSVGASTGGLEPDTTEIPGRTSTSASRTKLFDPAAGQRGKWSEGPMTRTLGGIGWSGIFPLLIKGGGPQCSSCGKVMVHFPGAGGLWKLYTPAVGAEGIGSWTAIDPSTHSPRGSMVSAIQLSDDPNVQGEECAPNCGKVLILGRGKSAPPGMANTIRPFAELYNPEDNTFQNIGEYGTGGYRNPNRPVQLRDGRVLIHSFNVNSRKLQAFDLFDPATLRITPIDEPAFSYVDNDKKAMLPDGGVLFTAAGTFSEIYRPGPRGGLDPLGGTWEIIPGCLAQSGGGPRDSGCLIVASLPDGRVLINRRHNSPFGPPQTGTNKEMYLFDSSQTALKAYSLAGPRVSPAAPHMAVLLEGTPAQCGINCGKILAVAVGRQADFTFVSEAELYRPPL